MQIVFDMQRTNDIYRPVEERKGDWREVERLLTDEELKDQTARCMNCGQPFCHAYGCPRPPERENGKSVAVVETVEREFSQESRLLKFHSVPGTKETIKADLVFLAMGFTGVPPENPIVSQLGIAETPRTALLSSPERNIHCVGDCASGASLVVRALASGKQIPLD